MMTGDYWAMGGYAAYVWPAYGLTVVILAGLLIGAVRALRQAERELAAFERARPRRKSAGPQTAEPPDSLAGRGAA
jgi:heme exporter protein D